MEVSKICVNLPIYLVMNYQWTLIERNLAKKRLYKIPDHFQGALNPIVPIEVRKVYFREFLRWQRSKYMIDHK